MSTPVMLLAGEHVGEQRFGLKATFAELAGAALSAGDRAEEQTQPAHCVRHELLLLLLSSHYAGRAYIHRGALERHFGLRHRRVNYVRRMSAGKFLLQSTAKRREREGEERGKEERNVES